ncbi:MAG: hypothetical protein ACFFBL_04010 [Promethearchaeota archaeon]
MPLILLVLLLTPSLAVGIPTKYNSSTLIKQSKVSQEIDGPSIQNLTYEITNYTDGSNDAVTIFCECSMLSNETQPAWQEHYLGNFLANRFEWNGENFNYTYSINPFLKNFNVTVILYDDMDNSASEQVQVDYDEGKDLIRNLPPEGFPDLTETSDTSVYVGQNATMIWYVMDNVLGLEVLLNGIVFMSDIFVNITPHVLKIIFTPQEVRMYTFSVRGYLEGTPFDTSSSLFVIEGHQELMVLSIADITPTTTNGLGGPVILSLLTGLGILGILMVAVLIRKK